ncbi:hypothetical protein [Microbacterium sp. YY-01]|uniref:hypothetical protein n=1 Tax=Microbacterium sp. YY-01 TaxID=3421634 RepID=UPI003D166161
MSTTEQRKRYEPTSAGNNMLTRQELDLMNAENMIMPLADEGQQEIIVILSEDASEAVHVLTAPQAIAYAERILELLRQHSYGSDDTKRGAV